MPPEQTQVRPEDQARERFERDTAEHRMTVLHDDGLYRHLRFQKPGTSFYWYDLITWPGVLAVSGDCGAYVFSRTRDMFEFFAGPRTAGINPHYWSEKLTAPAGREAVRVYDPDVYERRVRQWLDDVDADNALRLEADLELLDDFSGWQHSEDAARRLLHEFRSGDYYIDATEWDMRDWDWSFLWCCWAIARGIEQYRAVTPAFNDKRPHEETR